MKTDVLFKAKEFSDKYDKLMRGEKLGRENGIIETEYLFWLTQARQLLATESSNNQGLLQEWDKKANLEYYRFNPELPIHQYVQRHAEVYSFLIKNIKIEPAQKETLKTYCYKCVDETNQTVLFVDKSFGSQEVVGRNAEGDESQSVWTVVANIWTLSKCLGCGKINFTHIIRTSPDRATDKTFHFPKKPIREVPSWIMKLPIKYLEILQEVYISVNEDLVILPLTGIRTLLDIYMENKIGDIGGFKQKLTKMVAEKIITPTKATVLEAAIEAGNAAAHRGYKSDKETLFQILDIIENLLQSEIVDRPAKEIKEKIPPRRK